MTLLACPGCARHVRRTETCCPFCTAALDFSAVPPRPVPRTRLGRGAVFAFGAALSGQLAGCTTPSGPADAARDVPEDVRDFGDTAVYGGPDVPTPPTDTPAVDAGPEDGGVAPLYGGAPDAPAENDAGVDAGGGITPLYGGSPA
jgi:hypothetical protein